MEVAGPRTKSMVVVRVGVRVQGLGGDRTPVGGDSVCEVAGQNVVPGDATVAVNVRPGLAELLSVVADLRRPTLGLQSVQRSQLLEIKGLSSRARDLIQRFALNLMQKSVVQCCLKYHLHQNERPN